MKTELFASRIEQELSEEERLELLELLPPARRERLRLLSVERQREPLLAYGLLTRALQLRLGWGRLPNITLSLRGKPLFSQNLGVCFNLSHTQGAVLVGISSKPLGVDIERMRTISTRMKRHLQADNEGEFWKAWTRLEAMVKRRDSAGLLRGGALLPEPGEAVYSLSVFPGFQAAVACEEKQPPALTVYGLDFILQKKPDDA